VSRRSIALTLAAVASAAAVVVGAAGLFTRVPDPVDRGDVPVAPDVAPVAPAPPPTPTSTVGVRSGRLEDLPFPPPPPPVRVVVDSLGIDAPVVPVGVDTTAAVEVPTDAAVAGWYRHGPVPGEAGSAVVTAHVDTRGQGPGAFFRLRDARPGATVSITDEEGASRDFTVTGVRSYPKTGLPVDRLFSRTGEPVLALITCGGAYDTATRSYEDNVVVYAVPADPAPEPADRPLP
jgi:hypothetical protein